jgi:hypothetical protein
MGLDQWLESQKNNEEGYWRKANAIHQWFVHNAQNDNDDCKKYPVKRKKLESLLSICKIIKENPKIAKKLLPTHQGFFFGGYDYDQYYYECIDDTIKILEKALKDKKKKFYYQSSW